MNIPFKSKAEDPAKIIAIGSTVKIFDGSYMYTYKDGKKVHWGKFNSTHAPGLCKEHFVVLAQTENYGAMIEPYMSDWQRKAKIDTKIINIENGEVWYCNANVSLHNIVEDAAKYDLVKISSTEPPIDGRTHSVKVKVEYHNLPKIQVLVPVIEIVYVPVAVVKYVPVLITDYFFF